MSSSTTTNNNSSAKSLLLAPPKSDHSKPQNLNQNVSLTIKNPQPKSQNPTKSQQQHPQQPTNKKPPSCLYRLLCCCCACADSAETSTNTTNSTTTSTSSRNSNSNRPNRQTNAKIPKSAKSLPVKSNQPKPQPKIIPTNKKQQKQTDSKNKIPLKTLPPNKNNKRTSKNIPQQVQQSNLRLPRIQLPRPSLHPPERSLSCAHLESVLCATKTSSAGQPSSRTLVLLSNLSRSASTPNFAKNKYAYKNSKQVIPASNRTTKQVPPPRSATIDNVDDDEYDDDDDCGIYCGGPHRLDDRFKSSKNPTTSSDPVPVPLKSSGGEECKSSKLVFSTSYSSREGSCYLMESPPEYPIAERAVDVGWVGGWASDFDILLSDPIGIKAFTDFLRKEFSYENLQFFLTVQEFKKLINQEELREQANEIYQNFISSAAAEPVNVDSRARKAAEIGLKTEPLTNRIFALPEKQIYNLMKFDSYQRFLKSEIYKECALLELQGKPLPYESTNSPANGMANSSESRSGHSSPKQQKSQDGPVKQAKSKRRSLIPWARIKNSITSNTKAASLSSMPSHKESSFKRPMMMRKITNSITKIRSKSLDDHITSHINNSKHHHLTNNANNSSGDSTGSAGSAAAGQNGGHAPTAHAHPPPAGHSSSVDKAVNQKSLCDSRSSLIHPGVGSDSIDLSENNNVFSPSPDNAHESGGGMSRVASLSNESATSTDASPVSAGPVASSFNHNCNRDNCHFLRVVFPDRSQTVVPSTPNETIETLLRRLLDKRGLRYLAYDVFVTGAGVEEPKALDPGTNINSLGCTELRVEQRVLFQMDFPDGEVVGIKTRPNRKCGDVFKSVLVNYGYRPEHVMVVISESNIPPDLSLPVASIDGLNIIVNYRDDLEEWGWDPTPGRNNIPAALNASLKSSGSKDSPNKPADRSMGPGEDTQSDSFYREIIGSDPNSPPTSSALTSPFKIVSPAILQQIRLQQQQQMQHQLQQMQHLPAQQASPQSHQGSHQSTSSAAYGILSVKPSNQRSLEETSSTVSGPTSNASPPRRLNSASSDQQPQYFPAGNPRFHNSRIPNEIDLDSVTTQQNSINSAPVNQSAARTKASHLRELQNHQNFKSYLDGGAGATGSTVSGTTLPYNHETTANRIYNMTTNTTPYQGDLNSDEIQKQNQNSVASTFHQVPPPPMPLSMATSHHHAHASESSPPPEKPPLRRFQSEQQKPTSAPPPPLPPKSTTSNSIVSQSIPSSQSSNPPPPRPPPLANVVTGGSLGSAAPAQAFPNTTAHHHHHHPHHPSLYNNHHHNMHGHHGHHHHHHHHQLGGSGGSAKAGPIPGGVYQEATVSSGEASYV